MSKPQKIGTRSSRWSAHTVLTGIWLAIALITPSRPLAADRDDGGGRKCRGLSSEANADPSGFPQREVRRSRHGVLQTTLHACISTKEMLPRT